MLKWWNIRKNATLFFSSHCERRQKRVWNQHVIHLFCRDLTPTRPLFASSPYFKRKKKEKKRNKECCCCQQMESNHNNNNNNNNKRKTSSSTFIFFVTISLISVYWASVWTHDHQNRVCIHKTINVNAFLIKLAV